MPSDIYERMMDIFKDTPLRYKALTVVKKYCRSKDKTIDELEPEDCAILAVNLMSNGSFLLSKEEWEELDRKVKELLEKDSACGRRKVKGIILSCVLDYISLKWGHIAVKNMKYTLKLPEEFRNEIWYPLEILENMLERMECAKKSGGSSRCRDMGHHIMSREQFHSARYLFGDDPLIDNSFSNLQEIFMQDKFAVERENKEILVKFNSTSRYFHSFMMGMCEGIIRLRNISTSSVEEHPEEDGIITLSIRLEGA